MTTIEGLTLVFDTSVDTNHIWNNKGVPDMFIHNGKFKKIMDSVMDRQTALIARNMGAPINIILVYDPDRRIDKTPEDFWEKEFRLKTDRRHYEAAGIKFYLDYDKIERILEPEFKLQ